MCSKEFSVKQAGGSAQAQRMLKAWAVFSAESTTSKGDHFACWPDFKRLKELPSDQDLDTLAPTVWADHTDVAALEQTRGDEAVPNK